MICHHCGATVPDDVTYCTRCGAGVGLPADENRPLAAELGTPGGLTRLLLGGVLLVGTVLGIVVLTLYLLPPEHLRLPDLENAAPVAAVEDFAIGSSRVVRWGDRIVLVVRRGEQRYTAVQGTASNEECLIRWDREAEHFVSRCSHVVYDPHGNVVTGLTRRPLLRYGVFLREGVVYVTTAS